MSDLSTIIERLESLRDTWQRDALASVPDAYADRRMHDKYLRGDNEAAGQYACAVDLEDVILELEELRDPVRTAYRDGYVKGWEHRQVYTPDDGNYRDCGRRGAEQMADLYIGVPPEDDPGRRE